MKIPTLTRNQMSRLDRTAVREGFLELQMMEHAGRAVARVAQNLCERNAYVTILVGKGNNGGDGAAAARFLRNFGYRPTIVLAESRPLRPSTRHHIEIARKLDIPIVSGRKEETVLQALRGASLLIDALFGYNCAGHPRPPYADIIYYANAAKRKILAVDAPSGLDVTSGDHYEPTIEATATVTFALPKSGYFKESAAHFLGTLYIADVGIPEYVYRRARLPLPPANLFTEKDIVKVHDRVPELA
ncbi:MAG: NAD(P)H-hydrate epimerase [Parcubacteria group bacterium]|nr:NAD(P)H-hydrate epimerase [Parcubacteria group bacterium]